MNLFELFVKIGVDDQASKNLGSLSSKLGNGLKTAAKIGTAAVTAAATGIAALTTAAVKNYAEYEQLVGGVETLFKNSANIVQGYAENAYKTAGLSANQYMETVTSFSASLLQSLDGDTEQAAKIADTAITDMADNANKMGTSMEMIQNAYQGFAKQNYTMLDNLKLGYGGTKTEMERLIADANRVKEANGEMADLSIDSFADVTEAIHIIQTEMGITGTTAKEAASTISGSVSSMKSAWSNLVTGIADDNADMETLIDNFVESAGAAFDNILPRVEIALNGAAELVSRIMPQIMQRIPTIISKNLPVLADAAIGIVQSLVDGISENQEMLVSSAFEVIMTLANGLLNMLPEIVALGLDLIISLANGIAENLDTLIPTIVGVVLQIVDTLTNPDTLSALVDASIAIILALADGLIAALPQLLEKAPEIVSNLVTAIIENAPKLLEAAFELIVKLATGIFNNLKTVFNSGKEIVSTLLNGIVELRNKLVEKGREIIDTVKQGINAKIRDFVDIGKNIVNGVWTGIKNMASTFTSNIKSFFSNIVNSVKKTLGIASPSRVFRDEIGKQMAAGLSVGWEREFENVKRNIDNSLRFEEANMNISASIKRTGSASVAGTFGGSRLDRIEALLTAYLPQLANMSIVTETGALVGSLTPGMDSSLGQLEMYRARGNA